MQKILLVDDREDNLLAIEAILSQDGYSFYKANSGSQALKILLKEVDFAMILMDVKMPNMNGFETASLIYSREKLRHIPIIFITANNYGDENIFQGYKTGAVDYIYKPINPDLLRAKVAVFIELYKKNYKLRVQEQRLTAANLHLEKEIDERKKSELTVKELNKQLLENIQQLKSSNEELDHFAYIASHDLQEPLRKIRTFSDILMNKYQNKVDGTIIDYLSKIDKSSRRMQLLIDDILSFSRFTTNSESFKKTDLNEVVSQVLSDLEFSINEKQAIINKKDLPVVNVIPGMIRQLFQNLISNAVKFCRQNIIPEINITVSKVKGISIPEMVRGSEEMNFYAIEISDNGIGFEKQYADMIFVIFKRLHGNAKFEGTGIGLAICKKIVEKHNGYIYAQSEPGKGSTFTVALPI